MADVLARLEGVSVRRGRRLVLDAIDLEVKRGDRVAILGPNGAGKSTLLKAIAGLLPSSGTLELGERDARVLTHAERARRVAYVPQHSALEAAIPVWDVVAQGRFTFRGALAHPGKQDRAAIETAMRLVDVAALAARPFSHLSYGERRRVLLARALATEAPLVLLDEPTAALDVGHALALFDVLTTLVREGRGVVVVLHQLHEALGFADRSLLMADARAVAAGPTREVLTNEHVRAVYGVELIEAGAVGYRRTGATPT